MARVAADYRVDGPSVTEIYWQIGQIELPGFVGWQRNHTPGLLAAIMSGETISGRDSQ